ncbi:NACHT domain-containing protein [Actinokineospora soli]|uniref:NACHT domain-containing protein n=1 Tax=Actinokineospora soli TaxID=1048753 RepID=A0ABW2TK98_9PSEU
MTGGPGQGKSTLSLRLAADIATHLLEGAEPPLSEPVVPLRLTARELAARLTSPFPQALADSAVADHGAYLGPDLDPRVFAARVSGRRWLLLVDGLDEVASAPQRDRLVHVLAAWASTPDSPYRVVLTTRPIEGSALAPLQQIGAARYELQPFDEPALRRFAANWFDDPTHTDRFLRQIRAAHLHELVCVPLLATIAAIVYEQHGDRPLPDNQYELYESYLKYLRGRSEHTLQPLLEHLGRVRLEEDTSLIAAAESWARTHLPTTDGLIDQLTATGPFTRRGDDLRFLHHSFAEHLAATAQARRLPDRFTPDHGDFATLLHSARPDHQGRHARAVLLHYTHLHPSQADELLRWLHEGTADHHLLAARLLAAHLPASAETSAAFLATARDWAMTSTYPAMKILSAASRATHHPGLGHWLADLMRDEDAPGPPASKPPPHWPPACAGKQRRRPRPASSRPPATRRCRCRTASRRPKPSRSAEAPRGPPRKPASEASSTTRAPPRPIAARPRSSWPGSAPQPVSAP